MTPDDLDPIKRSGERRPWPWERPAAAAAVEVALAEAEQSLRERLVEEGRATRGAARDLFPHEIRAEVRFGELERAHAETAQLLARRLEGIRQAALAALARELAGSGTAADVVARLAGLLSPLHPDTLTVPVDTEPILAALLAHAEEAAAAVQAEARRQGVPEALLPRAGLTPAAQELLAAQAAALADAPVERVLRAAAEAATLGVPSTATAAQAARVALDAAEAAPTGALDDLARQVTTRAGGAGRAAGAQAAPPARSYASELLDGSTCGPCAVIDGKEYATLAAALADYPDAGGYRECAGGPRCRGTLVFVHGEAEPSR